MTIVAILLAAGQSRRFGTANKLLQDLDGAPLVRHALDAIDCAEVAEIIVVTGADSNAIQDACGSGRWRFVRNANPSAGLASSIRTGLAALPRSIAGVLIALGDMPDVSQALVSGLCQNFHQRGGEHIVYPQTAARQQGHPVIWPRTLFSELCALEGDTGGKHLLRLHADRCCPVNVETNDIVADIDTPADLMCRLGRSDRC